MREKTPALFRYLFLFMTIVFASCIGRDRTVIAVMTKLEAGSIVGTSEINMAKLFIEENAIDDIEIFSINDNWDPEQSKAALDTISKEGIKILITSHTSTCAVPIMDRINREKILTFVTGATTDVLTGRDDYIFRNIQDVKTEQESIAEYLNGMPVSSVLIVRDIDNIGYTDPALKYFRKYIRKTISGAIDINVSRINIAKLKAAMSGRNCDAVYLLIGGYKSNAAGTIAQVAKSLYPSCKIMFTPWVRSPQLLESAGGAIRDCILPSHYPPRGQNPALSRQIDVFKKKFGYAPTYISFNVYGALQILDEAIKAGHRAPDDIRRYILEKKTFRTKFITVSFNKYGDTDIPLYFVTDIEKEF